MSSIKSETILTTSYKHINSPSSFNSDDTYIYKDDEGFVEFHDRHNFSTDNPSVPLGTTLSTASTNSAYNAHELLDLFALFWCAMGIKAIGTPALNQFHLQQPFANDGFVTDFQSNTTSSKLANIYRGVEIIDSMSYGGGGTHDTRDNCEVIFGNVSIDTKQVISSNDPNANTDTLPFIPNNYASSVISQRIKFQQNYYPIPLFLTNNNKNVSFVLNESPGGNVNFVTLTVPVGSTQNTAKVQLANITGDVLQGFTDLGFNQLDLSFQLSQMLFTVNAASNRNRVYTSVTLVGGSVNTTASQQLALGFLHYRSERTDPGTGNFITVFSDIASTTVDNSSTYSLTVNNSTQKVNLARNASSANLANLTLKAGMNTRGYFFGGTNCFQPNYAGSGTTNLIGGQLIGLRLFNHFLSLSDTFSLRATNMSGSNRIEIGACSFAETVTPYKPQFFIYDNPCTGNAAFRVTRAVANNTGAVAFTYTTVFTATSANCSNNPSSTFALNNFFGSRSGGSLVWGDGQVTISGGQEILHIPMKQISGNTYHVVINITLNTLVVYRLPSNQLLNASVNSGTSNLIYVNGTATELVKATSLQPINKCRFFISNTEVPQGSLNAGFPVNYWSQDGTRIYSDADTGIYLRSARSQQLFDLSRLP
jgi:hypothetical protein